MNYPDLSSFGLDPWWLVLAKALGIFVFLVLTVLVAIMLERRVLSWMQMRIGPTGWARSGCSRAWPTASSSP